MVNDYIIFFLIFIAVSVLVFGFYSVYKDFCDLHNHLVELEKQYILKKLKGDNEDE